MPELGKTLYDMYAATQLENNNCEEPEWEQLDECDKQVWRDTADQFQLFVVG